jgi:hypothetical protein
MKTEDKILSALKAVVLLSEAQLDIQLGKHGEAFDKVRQAKIEILHAVYLLEVDPLQVTFSEWLDTKNLQHE